MTAVAQKQTSTEPAAPAAEIAETNPAGTCGFEFVEYTAADTAALGRLFERLGFRAVARHRSKAVTLYRQNGINFVVNQEPDSFAQAFARAHGPSACAMAFRVADAAQAFERAIGARRRAFDGRIGPMELNIPAIKGIGGSLIYLVDRFQAPHSDTSIYDVDFVPLEGVDPEPEGRRPRPGGPPDPQRLPRPHGPLGRVLRAPVQFPRDPLLRHRGQADRPQEPRHDQPLRPDPHPDQRVLPTTSRRSRSISPPTRARASSTSR